MGFFEELLKMAKKYDEANPQPQPQPQPQIDYKAEYEKLMAQNTQLQKTLTDAQNANASLLNKTPLNSGNQSFSEIMRSQEYHPLYERRN